MPRLATTALCLAALLSSPAEVLAQLGDPLGPESAAVVAFVQHVGSWGELEIDGCSLTRAVDGRVDLDALGPQLHWVDTLDDPCASRRDVQVGPIALFQSIEFSDSVAFATVRRWYALHSFVDSRLRAEPGRRFWLVQSASVVGRGSASLLPRQQPFDGVRAAIAAVLEEVAEPVLLDEGHAASEIHVFPESRAAASSLIPVTYYPAPSDDECAERLERTAWMLEAIGAEFNCAPQRRALGELGLQPGDFMAAAACWSEFLTFEGAEVSRLPTTDQCERPFAPVVLASNGQSVRLGQFRYTIRLAGPARLSRFEVLLDSSGSVVSVSLREQVSRPGGVV